MNLYNVSNKIKFTSISERYQIPKVYKYQLSLIHSALIEYVCGHFRNTSKYKQQVVDALNVLTYCVLSNEVPPYDWSSQSPLSTMPDVDMESVESTLGALFLTVDSIDWDVQPTSTDIEAASYSQVDAVAPKPPADKRSPIKPESKRVFNPEYADSAAVPETSKEDLYIKAPTYPQFDYNKPWLSRQDGPDKLVIYTTLPEIPTKQNEISVTTDVSAMTRAELMRLYPTKLIRTRASAMYEPIDGIELHSDLGLLLPIDGYSRDELLDNIIEYPHFYKLQRLVGDEVRSFYADIEIDGDLVPIEEAWDLIKESNIIPKQSDFIKEYIVRRYLLEESHGVSHKYKMYGSLDKYLTLFMPASQYIQYGHSNTEEIAKQCVKSRVSFKQTRNPILRRLHFYDV